MADTLIINSLQTSQRSLPSRQTSGFVTFLDINLKVQNKSKSTIYIADSSSFTIEVDDGGNELTLKLGVLEDPIDSQSRTIKSIPAFVEVKPGSKHDINIALPQELRFLQSDHEQRLRVVEIRNVKKLNVNVGYLNNPPICRTQLPRREILKKLKESINWVTADTKLSLYKK